MKIIMRYCLVLIMTILLANCSIVERMTEMDSLGRDNIDKEKEEEGRADVTIHNQKIGSDSIWISGYITEMETGEPILFGTVGFYAKDKIIAGTETDFDGNFSLFIPMEKVRSLRVLHIEISYLGLRTLKVTLPDFSAGDQMEFTISMAPTEIIFNGPWYHCCWPPIYDPSEMSSGQTFTSEQIRNSPTRG